MNILFGTLFKDAGGSGILFYEFYMGFLFPTYPILAQRNIIVYYNKASINQN